MRHAIRKRKWTSLLAVLAVLAGLGVALYLRAKAPPEAARLLPESDAIIYIQLSTLRDATHFDQTPVTHSADFQHFIDATGIVPERDLDAVAFALHRMPNPNGPNGPVAYSEVFVGHFDGTRLAKYLDSIAASKDVYAGHTVYSIPIEGRTLRVAQLGYDSVAASNMPTPEQIHSMIDRFRTSALWTSGSSLLTARYHQVPLLSQAWGIGRIGLPFSHEGHIALFGLDLPVAADTQLVASLRYTGEVHLRVVEFAHDAEQAHSTVDAMNALLNIARGLVEAAPENGAAAQAVRAILGSMHISVQHETDALLTAKATVAQVKALADVHDPAAAVTAPAAGDTTSPLDLPGTGSQDGASSETPESSASNGAAAASKHHHGPRIPSP